MPGYETLLNQPILAAITNNTFTAALDITSTTTQPPMVIPANFIMPDGNSIIKVSAFGTFSTTGTPTLVLGTYWGTTVLAVNVALTTASGAATLPWRLETTTMVRAAGTSGAAMTQGFLDYGTTLTATTRIPVPGIALATVAIDTTAAAALTVKATWSASSSSNIVVTHGFTVECLNFVP